ncbi:uncharacterized protein FIBRA_08382 [Fibroporia radiculosa]|uniref:Ketoreductase domain-containing protein n=1 Tax=Fibroporia radiculosa TaxID=599839 RepID=J4I2M7_9APHY|nr:uncharacterized protein FIBRA_08382 [Fibroporia radiculosa]CCM06132.1 predicted protein [Fibroporia radiculosa]
MPKSINGVPPGCVLVDVLSVTSAGKVVGVVGFVVEDSPEVLQHNYFLVGLAEHVHGQRATLDADGVSSVSSRLTQRFTFLSALLPGFVVAVLASGISAFRQLKRLRSTSMLLAHSDTHIGLGVKKLYLLKGIEFTEVTRGTSLRDLAALGRERFDLIITGHEDKGSLQIIQTLLHPTRGKLFAWNDDSIGLAGILRRDPLAIRDALELVISFLEESSDSLYAEIVDETSSIPHFTVSETNEHSLQRNAVFCADKSYIILGGRGARHIIVTSRRGEDGLFTNGDVLARRIFEHLRSIQDLELRVCAVDATSTVEMRDLMHSLPAPLGGCMILTAVLSDRAFQNLTREDYSRVFAAKLGVLSVLQEVVDIPSIDFLVAFSSVSGLFGAGGQTNYGAANTALEEAISLIPNAFSFVCPGILDSSMLLVGQSNVQASLFSHFLEWSISAEEMILWLEDAIFRFQNGQKFHHYVPDLDWESVDKTLGMPPMGRHLVPVQVAQDVSARDDVDQLADTVRDVLNVSASDLSPDAPLTTYGIDSLSAARLAASGGDSALSAAEELFKATSKEDEMRELLEKYLVRLHETPRVQEVAPDAHVVLLTGSTGGLGCHLLVELLDRNDVKQVYALNRRAHDPGSTLLRRQMDALLNQGLLTDILESPKLTLLEGDLEADDLGLDDLTMTNLSSSIAHIIHNDPVVIPTPELPILNAKIATQTGCLESKWIAERLVQLAAETTRLKVNVIRVGLLTGSASGSWDIQHWFPALVQSATYVGCLPDGNENISWLTTPLAATAIVDVYNIANGTLHIVHPRPVKWVTIMEPLTLKFDVPVVPYHEWFARLENLAITTPANKSSGNREREAEERAALRLLDFFRKGSQNAGSYSHHMESKGLLPSVESQRGQHASSVLMDSNTPQLSCSDVDKWMSTWKKVGFLPTGMQT